MSITVEDFQRAGEPITPAEHGFVLQCSVDEVDGVLSALFVAVAAGSHIEILGSCELRLAGDCADLRRMVVHPARRLIGIGRALFGEAVAVASLLHKRSIAFSVRKDSPAVAFYEALGCQVFGDDHQDWWMAYVLNGTRLRESRSL